MKQVDYKKVGKRIRTKRKEFALKQKEAAIKVGVSPHYWSDMETGKVNSISLKTLFSIAILFDTNLNYFVADLIDDNKDIIYEEIETMLEGMTKNQRIISMDLLNVVYNNPEMFETTEIGGYVKDEEYYDKY